MDVHHACDMARQQCCETTTGEQAVSRVEQQASLRVPVYIAALGLAIWTLVAIGHILRAALERPLALCLVLALLQMLVEEVLFLRIFGPGQ